MATPPLTRDGDLQHFPGGPYPAAVIRAAEKSVRGDAGWHIAPPRRETITVSGTNSRHLFLPTQRVAVVHSVTTEDLQPVTGWWLSHSDGVHLVTGSGSYWRAGRDYLVDMTHGYDAEDVDDLLPIVASRCQRQLADALLTQRSETVGTKTSSESYNIARFEVANASEAALEHYKLPAVA